MTLLIIVWCLQDVGRLSKKKESQFLAALMRIRQGDKRILQEDLNLFDSSSEDEESGETINEMERKTPSLTVRDVQTKRVVE